MYIVIDSVVMGWTVSETWESILIILKQMTSISPRKNGKGARPYAHTGSGALKGYTYLIYEQMKLVSDFK